MKQKPTCYAGGVKSLYRKTPFRSIPYGYNRLPSDKQTLVVDPVASEVVKRIFLLANEGKSPRATAEILTEEKVLIPAAYAKEYHPEQYNGIKFADPYIWGISAIRTILSRQEYLGHTVFVCKDVVGKGVPP